MDRVFEEGRLERRPAAREAIYRRFENALLEDAVLIPLFHELDYRLSGPSVRGLALRSGAPFVNYVELGKRVDAPPPATRPRETGGAIEVPKTGVVGTVDPALALMHEQAEIVPIAFESRTRAGRGTVNPWLAVGV